MALSFACLPICRFAASQSITHSLRAALRGLLGKDFDNRTRIPLARAFTLADESIGTSALSKLYQQRRYTAVQTNLTAIWQSLGVVKQGAQVVFDDNAPQIWLRRAVESSQTA